MAYDEGLAQIMHETLMGLEIDENALLEKKMFGGLCYMYRGHMLCGITNSGGMARLGKTLEKDALQIETVRPLSFTGRKMGGLIEFDEDVFETQELENILCLALEFNQSLDPK